MTRIPPSWRLALLVLALPLAPAGASARAVTVTTAADVIDISPTGGTVADPPGPDGVVSCAEAMIATNNTPGHPTIAFQIPKNEWILQFLLPGRAVIAGNDFNFRAYDAVTIDGTTQTAFTGDTNPDGNEVAFYGATVYLNTDNCTLRGIDSTPVYVNGSSNTVEDNTGTMQITVFGGGNNLIRDNTGGTIKLDRTSNNVVVGNTVQRVRVLGWLGGGAPAVNNRVGGPTLAERNFITGYGTTNSEGLPSGTTVQIVDSIGTVVENNWIGTTPDGMAQGSLFSIIGIGLEGDNVGTRIRGNRIAGILGHGQPPHHAGQLFGWGIFVSGDGSDIEITGNTLGLDATGAPTLGSVWGVSVGDAVTGPWAAPTSRSGARSLGTATRSPGTS